MSRLIAALADARRPTSGACCLCGEPAAHWHRSGRRSTDADGLTVAVRVCAAHDADAIPAMGALTIADIAALVPTSRCASRAAGARIRADRLTGRGHRYMRSSAAMRGASSAAHTYAALGGLADLEAQALRRLSDALIGRIGGVS